MRTSPAATCYRIAKGLRRVNPAPRHRPGVQPNLTMMWRGTV
jgi:hypothetical protein